MSHERRKRIAKRRRAEAARRSYRDSVLKFIERIGVIPAATIALAHRYGWTRWV